MSTDLVFALNGKITRIPASQVDPELNLNEYIRTQTSFKGTKLSCGEGGCGACTVALSRYDGDRVETISVVSCLRPFALCDGWAITTTEGLGNSKTGFHPIQERIADFHGLQCGFCTPGFVMSMYAALQTPEFDTKGIPNHLDGNICRCTGYRPILDTFKSLCKDHTVRDMVSKKAQLGPYPSIFDPKFPQELKNNYTKHELIFHAHGVKWIRPTSLKGVLSILDQCEPRSVSLVAGRTGFAFDKRKYSILVDIHSLPELRKIELRPAGLQVGAAVSLSNLARALLAHSHKSCIFSPLAALIKQIASTQIRNVGSVAGNLVMAKQLPFVSDLATGLLAAQATITLISKKNHEKKVSMDSFLATPNFFAGEMVFSIYIPFTKPNNHYNAYKASVRHHNSHALVNAAFNFKLNGSTIKKAVCAFGYSSGRSNQRLSRASKTEMYLEMKRLTKDTLEKAISMLKDEIVPKGERKQYKQNVMMGFFYRFFLSLIMVKPDKLVSLTVPFSRPVTSSSQTFKYPATHAPVSEPIPELFGKLKAAGEAQFTDDYMERKGTLFAALVTSREACAKILSIDASEALTKPGVLQFICAKDIPGENNASTWGEMYPLFADKEVMFYGQSVGLILADSSERAWNAAEIVMVRYDRSAKKPVVSLDQAQQQKTEIFDTIQHKTGECDNIESMNEYIVKGNVFMNTQQHFYMEPQTSYCVPDEDNRMVLYCATQFPAHVSDAIGRLLDVGKNAIQVVHRRTGGAFGGKLAHQVLPACAVAVAASITGRPVKIALRRGVDMALCGGREEMLSKYNVAFDKTGKISHVKIMTAANAGCQKGLAFFANLTVPHASNECYDWKNYDHTSKLFFTNTAPRTPMRAPGDVQASYIAETIIDHVAQTLNLPRDEVSERNFYPFKPKHPDDLKLPNGKTISHWTLPRMWPKLKAKVNWKSIKEEVDSFNKNNRWRKRGAAIIPIRYEVAVIPRQAMVNVYSDGTVIVNVDGCEMGQGLHTKVIQAVAYEFGKIYGGDKQYMPLDLIRMADISSHVTPNAGPTGGSTGSEGSVAAALLCCKELIERLLKVKNSSEETKKMTWPELCQVAASTGHLSAINFYAEGLSYQNLGVGATTVEIDVVTGQVEILSSDLIYDCGKSLNPAIDIGQAEGAFVIGLGFYFTEEVVISEHNGRVMHNNTWNYKPPLASDIPINFSVEFLQDSGFSKGILSSKASGEPPLCLATSVMMAVKSAIYAARSEVGLNGFIELSTPATPADIAIACGTSPNHFTLPDVPLPRM